MISRLPVLPRRRRSGPYRRRPYRRAKLGQFVIAAHEAGQPACRRDLHRPARRAGPRNRVHIDHPLQAANRPPAKRHCLDITRDQPDGIGGCENGTGLGHLLHAGGQVCRLPHRRVVHLEIAADGPDHHLAGVQAYPDLRLDPVQPAKAFGVPLDGLLHPERGIARPHRVIFVGQRSAEERHDPVSHDLVDGALVEVDGLHHAFEHRVDELARFFGITIGQELQRSLEVGEEHGHSFALAFERALRRQDLFGEMLWRVGVWGDGE